MKKQHGGLLVVAILYLLHFDFWLWQRPDLVLGLPVGLLYHVLYCLGVSAVLAVLVRFTRIRDLSAD